MILLYIKYIGNANKKSPYTRGFFIYKTLNYIAVPVAVAPEASTVEVVVVVSTIPVATSTLTSVPVAVAPEFVSTGVTLAPHDARRRVAVATRSRTFITKKII